MRSGDLKMTLQGGGYVGLRCRGWNTERIIGLKLAGWDGSPPFEIQIISAWNRDGGRFSRILENKVARK